MPPKVPGAGNANKKEKKEKKEKKTKQVDVVPVPTTDATPTAALNQTIGGMGTEGEVDIKDLIAAGIEDDGKLKRKEGFKNDFHIFGGEEDDFYRKWSGPMLLGPFVPAVFAVFIILTGELLLNTWKGTCGYSLDCKT